MATLNITRGDLWKWESSSSRGSRRLGNLAVMETEVMREGEERRRLGH